MLFDQPTLCPFCAEAITDPASAGTMLTWHGLTDIDAIPDVTTGCNFHVACLDKAVHEQFKGMVLPATRNM
jgi:hypothetical protein